MNMIKELTLYKELPSKYTGKSSDKGQALSYSFILPCLHLWSSQHQYPFPSSIQALVYHPC